MHFKILVLIGLLSACGESGPNSANKRETNSANSTGSESSVANDVPEEKEKETEVQNTNNNSASNGDLGDQDTLNKESPADDAVATLSVPVHVVLIQSDISEIDGRKGDAEALLAKANTFWQSAGIEIKKIKQSEAVSPNEEKLKEWLASGTAGVSQTGQEQLAAGLPLDQISSEGWTMFVLGTMNATPGVFLPRIKAVVIGLDNPRGPIEPRIVAHEFGHSFGLQHDTSDDLNLMAQKKANVENKDMTHLTSEQISIAKAQIKLGVPFSK